MEAGGKEQKCACNLQQEESEADFYKRCAGDTAGSRRDVSLERGKPAGDAEVSSSGTLVTKAAFLTRQEFACKVGFSPDCPAGFYLRGGVAFLPTPKEQGLTRAIS